VCVGGVEDTTYTFSVPENITTTVSSGSASFSGIEIYQGTFLRNQFVVDGSLDQRFILDTSTIVVYVKGISDTGLGRQYKLVDNILTLDGSSETYLIQEIKDEKYELLFGDGIFGKKLEDGTIITVTYIVTDGKDGNGASLFSFSGSLRGSSDEIVTPSSSVSITTSIASSNGGDIESIDSIKYFAPRLYSSQYRAVTGRDYESIIQSIYPNTESVSVVGGEELDPPQFGTVLISIKPKNGDYVSDFDKQQILSKLKNYSLTGINQSIIDLKVLYVEIDSAVYYDSPRVSNINDLKTRITSALNTYSSSTDLNKFGGRFKYSKLVRVIDDVDTAITSNVTRIIIRRNLKAAINQFAQYELCFGNQFHIDPKGFNIKSTAFKISGEADFVYLTDVPNKNSLGNLDGSGTGILSVVKPDPNGVDNIVVVKSAGTINYTTGEIILTTINITETDLENNIVQIQAYPESNDIIGLKDLYLSFSVADSTINMVKDTISSGEQISGFKVTSSYLNGELKRI
jgi:hypothetical protein